MSNDSFQQFFGMNQRGTEFLIRFCLGNNAYALSGRLHSINLTRDGEAVTYGEGEIVVFYLLNCLSKV